MKKRTVKRIKETAAGIAFLGAMAAGMWIGGYADSTYTMNATVDTYEGEKCFVDMQGHAWSDDRVDDYAIGDEVKIVFLNCGTHTRTDDIVYKVK